VSLTIRGRGRGRDPDRSVRWGHALWWCCAWVVTAAGLLCAHAEYGWALPVTLGSSVAILAAACATALWIEDGVGAVSRIVRLAVEAGVAAPAAVGLLAVFGLVGLVVIVLVAATWPGLAPLVRARWPRALPAAEPWPSFASSGQAPGDEGVESVRRPDVPEELTALDDDELCLAWRRSFLLLNAAGSPGERLLLVEQRQRYLDELERRSPVGLASWLTSGARAPGNPLPHLRAHPRRTG